jgi:hypothetical protein
MGVWFSSVLNQLSGIHQKKILLVVSPSTLISIYDLSFQKGLDGAGKTAILYHLNSLDAMPTIPTIGAFSSNNPLFVSHNRSRIQC